MRYAAKGECWTGKYIAQITRTYLQNKQKIASKFGIQDVGSLICSKQDTILIDALSSDVSLPIFDLPKQHEHSERLTVILETRTNFRWTSQNFEQKK